MMETKVKIQFQLKITDVLDDGFIGVDPESNEIFKKKSLIKDRLALSNSRYRKDDIVEISVETIDDFEIRSDKKWKEFYCVVYELTNNGFYTKLYEENESKFKRIFFYEARGMITFPKEELERFEVSDVIKVNIRRI